MNTSPGLKIMPSGMFSLTRLAFAHSAFDGTAGGVGDGTVGNGVIFVVGSKAISVGSADGVSVFAGNSTLWAATVWATAVWMVASCAFPEPHAERISDEITTEVKSMYLICLDIFFLS